MAGQVKPLSFASRQAGIVACGVVNLKFTEGDLRAEYLSGTEIQLTGGEWRYDFLIQEEDLPGSLTLDDVRNDNIITPYWECPVEAEVPEEECPARQIVCFESIEGIEEILDTDEIAVLRFDETCNLWCLKRFPADEFLQGETAVQTIYPYEYQVVPPDQDLQDVDELLVGFLPCNFRAVTAYASFFYAGTNTAKIKVYVNGFNVIPGDGFLSANAAGSSGAIVALPTYAANINFPDGELPIYGRVTVKIYDTGYIQYGDNLKGLSIGFTGRGLDPNP